MKFLFKVVERLYHKKIDGTGLSVVRIAFTLIMLCDVLQLYYFRHLIFDPVPYLVPSEIAVWPVFLFWVLALIFIIFGLFTRLATIINYILTVVVLGTISSFEYHMFYCYLTMSFLFMFLPISQNLSLDRLLVKLKYSNTRVHYNPPREVSVLSYLVPVFLGLGVVYIDSTFYKYGSELWLSGLGLWLPASIPQAVLVDITPLLNLKYLVIGLGYLTLLFETVFVFMFWRKKWRLPVFIVGVCLHIGILICFPIPFFALGVIALYLLMIPVSWWNRWFGRPKDPTTILKFYYDGECPLCNRTKIILDHFNGSKHIEFLAVQTHADKEPALNGVDREDLLKNIYSVDNKGKVYSGLDTYIRTFRTVWYLKPLSVILSFPGIYHLGVSAYRSIAKSRYADRCAEESCGFTPPVLPYGSSDMKIFTNFTLNDIRIGAVTCGLVLACVFQVIITFNSKVIIDLIKVVGIENTIGVRGAAYVSDRLNKVTKTFFGITNHALFMDSHFDQYNHSIAVVYSNKKGERTWLPIIDENGTTGDYLFGSNWAKWTFRVNSPKIDQATLIDGLRDFTAFWAYKNGVSLRDATFEIRVKKGEIPKRWAFNFLKEQMRHPWIDGGTVHWVDGKFAAKVYVIENL